MREVAAIPTWSVPGHLARPIRIADTARATQWQATWGPWGEPQSISGTLALDMRFPDRHC